MLSYTLIPPKNSRRGTQSLAEGVAWCLHIHMDSPAAHQMPINAIVASFKIQERSYAAENYQQQLSQLRLNIKMMANQISGHETAV